MTISTAEIGDFLEHEAELLDGRQFREWLALFAPDSYYWIPIDPNQADPFQAPSHVYERRPVLAARVERLYDPRVVPQRPASRTCRILGPARILGQTADGAVLARAKFHLMEARATHDIEDESRIFAGTSTYALMPASAGFLIAWKRVDLINSESGMRGVSIVF
jgi:3-phenylpropionate/cinnamic acid dioxygenase small subunit